MKSRLIKLSAFAIATIAPLLVGAVSAGAVASNQTFPVTGVVSDPCSGQDWAFSGKIHLLAAFTSDSSGGLHIDLQDNASEIKLTNVVTGATGVGTETDHFTVNVPAGANEVTANGQFTEITAGPSDNFVILYLIHITMNANGTMTVFINNFTAMCVG